MFPPMQFPYYYPPQMFPPPFMGGEYALNGQPPGWRGSFHRNELSVPHSNAAAMGQLDSDEEAARKRATSFSDDDEECEK